METFSSWERMNMSVGVMKLAWWTEEPWLMVWWRASSSSVMVVL